MKKKTFYLFILILSISLISSAKKIKSNCGNAMVCCQTEKAETADEGELNLPFLGLFLFSN
jgi:hypothetical protein